MRVILDEDDLGVQSVQGKSHLTRSSVFVEYSLDLLQIRTLCQGELQEYSRLVCQQVISFDELVLRVDGNTVVHAAARCTDI